MSRLNQYLEAINNQEDEKKDNDLKQLIGPHKLSGVDRSSEHYANAIDFILDGKELRAIEDENDGYRSMFEKIITLPKGTIKNKFKSVDVIGRWAKNGMPIIELADVKTKKNVLIIGTDETDNWYPFFVAKWNPQNLSLNKDVKEN